MFLIQSIIIACLSYRLKKFQERNVSCIYLFAIETHRIAPWSGSHQLWIVGGITIAKESGVESMNSSIGSYKNHAFNPYFSTSESGISEIEDITYMP
ncbi:unnamed protein product, partial [Porites evermanni]